MPRDDGFRAALTPRALARRACAYAPVVLAFFVALQPCHAAEVVTVAYGGAPGDAAGAYLFAGKQLGFFSAQGIDLKIQPTQGSVGSAAFIASGAIEVGAGGVESVPGYAAQGVPMESVYVVAPHPTWKLAFLAGSKIQSVAALRNARIGVVSLSSGAVPMLQFILNESGLRLTDVRLLPLGKTASAITAIKSGEIDALMFDDTGRTLFQRNGINLNVYSDLQLDAGYPGSGVYMLKSTLVRRRAAIVAFLRGLTKSLIYSTQNPAGAVDAIARAYPEVARDKPVEDALWRARATISVPPESKPWGYMSDAGWENLIKVQRQSGILKKDLPVSAVYTRELLAEANALEPGK